MKTIEPYYQDDSVTLYCADCIDVLPGLPKVDLVLTDPPYGINADKAAAKNEGKRGWKDYGMTDWDKSRPDREAFELIMSKVSNGTIIWGGNYFADLLPPSMGWLSWDKGQRNFSLADFEMAWTSWHVASRCIEISRAEALQDIKEHPTQKPVRLFEWCIDKADKNAGKKNEVILDPFAGSGTTGVAAKALGRKAILIEREEKYCEIIVKRLAQDYLSL